MRSWNTIRRGWESRFPHLDEDWTHWWIEGDANFLVLIDGCNLSEAVEFVMENCDLYISIKAIRAKFNSEGTPIREDKRVYEIANKKNERRPCFPNSKNNNNLTTQSSGCGKPPR
jgi:hypothetical protein